MILVGIERKHDLKWVKTNSNQTQTEPALTCSKLTIENIGARAGGGKGREEEGSRLSGIAVVNTE